MQQFRLLIPRLKQYNSSLQYGQIHDLTVFVVRGTAQHAVYYFPVLYTAHLK